MFVLNDADYDTKTADDHVHPKRQMAIKIMASNEFAWSNWSLQKVNAIRKLQKKKTFNKHSKSFGIKILWIEWLRVHIFNEHSSITYHKYKIIVLNDNKAYTNDGDTIWNSKSFLEFVFVSFVRQMISIESQNGYLIGFYFR